MKKTNKLISILIAVAMLLSMAPLSLTAFAAVELTDSTTDVTLKDTDGDGFYEIGTAEQLYAFANLVNAGNATINAELTDDILLNQNVIAADGSLNGEPSEFKKWTPIGTEEVNYAGVFDGAKHTISGLFYHGDGEYAGLFGYTKGEYKSESSGFIKELGLVDSYFLVEGTQSTYRVGGLVGFAYNTSAKNCYVIANFDLTSTYYVVPFGPLVYIGGIYGMTSYVDAKNCYTVINVTVEGKSVDMNSIGGFFGESTNEKMINCHTNYNSWGYCNGGSELTGSTIGVTKEKFQSGEIAYLLNDSMADNNSVWKQTLGEDEYPSFNGNYVEYDETKGYYNPAHSHSFEYSANGDTITEICTAQYCPFMNCKGGTLTISAPAELYVDGITAKEATIENNLVDTSVEVSDITYSAPYGLPPKDAGTYTASVTVGGATATVEFTLLNYAAKVTDKDGNELEGSPYKTFADAIVAAQGSEGSTVTLLDDITLSATQNIDSGTFTLDLNEKKLLNDAKCVLSIESDADVTIKDSGDGGTVQSNGKNTNGILNSGTLTVESGFYKSSCGIFNRGTLVFKNGEIESGTFSTIVNRGSAYVYNGKFETTNGNTIFNVSNSTIYIYGGEMGGNSSIVNFGTAYIYGGEFIGKSSAALNLYEGSVTEVTGGSFAGKDDEHGNYSGTPYGEWTVCYTEGATLTLKGGEFPNGFVFDETTANAFLAEDYYYKDADGKLIDVADDAKIINGYVKVSKGADLADAVITLDSTEFTYNGSEIKPTVIVTVGGKALTEGKDYTLTFANNVNAGKATVTVTGAGDYTGEATKEFTIVKADNTVTAAPTPNTLTYNGEAHNLISAGEASFGTMVYSLDGAEYSETIPQGTDAGDYIVYYKVIGDSNHNDTVAETVTVTINAKDISDGFIILGDALTYNGTEQTQTVEKVLPTGTAPEATYTVSGNKATNVGVYLLTVTGTGNFTGEAKIAYEIAVDASGVEGLTIENVKSSDKENVEYVYNQLENAVKDLADEDKISEWNTLQSYCAAMRQRIEIVENQIEAFENKLGEYDIDTVTSDDAADLESFRNSVGNFYNDYYDNLTDEQEKKITDIYSEIEDLETRISDVAEEITRITDAVNSYDEATVKSSDKTDIEQLKADIKAITDGQNITADERAKLENLDATADALLAKIAETKSEYDRVIAAANGYDEATVTSADKDALIQLNDDIYALALTDNVTEEEKENLQAAHDKVLGLIDKLTDISDEIKRIIEAVDKYVFESVKSSDKTDIEQLIADIKALLDTQNITADERTLLLSADETCTKLIEKIDETVAEISRINDATNSYDIDTVTSADKADIEKLLADIKALTDGDNITDAEREQLNGNEATLNALLDKINATAEEIARIETAVNGYDEETVKSTDKADLEQLKSDIKALTDATNITENERTKLGELDAKIDALIKKIDDTAAEIERIDEAVNGYDKETVTSADVPELGKLIEDIKALTDGNNLTEDEKGALEETDKVIDELVEKLTEVAEEIKKVDEAVKSYDEETVKSTDKEDLTQLKEDIQSLIDSDNTTENEKTALGEMIEKVEALEDKIEETEQQLEEIKDIENGYNPENVSSDDKAAIEDKIAEIEDVNPDNLTDEQKAEYEEIKVGLEALLEEIAAAEKNVADIGIELEMFDENRVTKFWEDDIEALKAKIDELLADENMGETEKAKLNEYKAQAEKLIEIINTPKEYISCRFFYLIWDCLNWKWDGILWLFKQIFAC